MVKIGNLSLAAAMVLLAAVIGASTALPWGPADDEDRRPIRGHVQGDRGGRRGGGGSRGGGCRGGGCRAAGGCRIVYKTVQTIVDVEREENVCHPVNDRVCSTKYRRACTPYTDTECKVERREVCQTSYERKCRTLYRQVPEHYHEDECHEVDRRVCDSHWVHHGADKVWEEDPSTCKLLPETVCKQVRKTRTKKEPYEDCQNVPSKDCRNVPERKCREVTRQDCQRVAYQDCHNVTKQKCEKKHVKSPQTQSATKPVRVCDNDHGGNNGYKW